MNIKRITKQLFAFAMLLMLTMSAQASHWIAGNFEIKYDSTQNKYRIRIYWYNDCGGISPPTSASVTLGSSCGSQNVTLNQILADVDQGINPGDDGTPAEGYFFSNLCPLYQQCSECIDNNPPICSDPNSGIPVVPVPGVELYIYEGFVALPPCNDWTISYTSCCRNGLPTSYTTNGGDNDSWFIYGVFNNNFAVNNSSPEFINKTVDPFICDNTIYEYSFEAIDVDGDSLVYSLVAPLQNNLTSPIIYNPGYSPTNFIQTEPGTGGIYFEDSTGFMSFTPLFGAKQQVYFSVKVDEYRSGIYLGSIVKDIQLNTISNCQPLDAFVASDGIVELTGGQYFTTVGDSNEVSNTTIYVCAGDTLRFSIVVADTVNNNATFELFTDFTDSLPNSKFTTASFSDSTGVYLTGIFEYIAENEDVDTTGFNFTVEARNNACPIKRVDVFDFFLEVKANTFAEPDEALFCFTGDTIQLSVKGGDSFNWRFDMLDPRDDGSDKAISCDTCEITWVYPPYDRLYIVKSDLGKYGCQDEDTVEVQAIRYPEILGDTCIEVDGEIILTAFWEWADDTTSGKIEYMWNLDEDLDEDELTVSELDTIYLQVEDVTNNCIMTDTVLLDEQCPFIIPNVITPNGDGINDKFVIKGKGKDEWNIYIYNRWGQLVYEKIAYGDEFDASGLPDGAYLFELTKQVEGEITTYRGWLQILR